MQSSNYEFDGSQNVLIGQLASRMKFVSIFLIIAGVLTVVFGLLGSGDGIGSMISGIADFLIGIWTYQASTAFKRIVDTQGQDIENLMGALGELRKLYTLQYWVLIITLVALVIVFGLGVVLGLFSALG
ncbi:hypothetical protein PJF56_05775 [Roseofilum sp. BLCC_M91]|uniref:DUF5362 domain-containing protein n=1 Tax=Roseofilum halophilum BLCC-M91 TaxID=3022259 RepID=A0ABT7BGQ7_9CYAN|nr:hypothetical protein [Roseofilum halophilum]MDJ1178365.1 hypothetical protein [Roseofilum halophilum BLCC-M91]